MKAYIAEAMLIQRIGGRCCSGIQRLTDGCDVKVKTSAMTSDIST